MQNPYNHLPSFYINRPELFAFLKNSPRTDYIITLIIDGDMTNELLQWDGEHDCWAWSNDWYEGQKEITWMAIVALDDVVTYVPEVDDTSYRWRT